MASYQDEAVNKRKYVDCEMKCTEERKSGPSETCRRSYPREDTPPAQCSVLCGPRTSSTLPSSLGNQIDAGTSPPEPKRRRLWRLRGLVKMFRRRVKRKVAMDSSEGPEGPAPTLRARSASELTVDQNSRTSGGPYNQGLSVSHDSVFSPESPTEPTHTAPPGLALATRGVNMSELKAVLRRRRGMDSESVEENPDEPGFPHSSQASPTTQNVLNPSLKSSSRGRPSSCSDGSLLSVGSSENDEDSLGLTSHYSSKHSLIEGQLPFVDQEPAIGAALSHNAARHKISVKPKRTHGIPRAKRPPQMTKAARTYQSQHPPHKLHPEDCVQVVTSSLPTTPEVNEDILVHSGSSTHSTSISSTGRYPYNQRPSSISYSSTETQAIKMRTEVSEDRRNVRRSLPEPTPNAEEKKDELLLTRLFGSIQGGQQQPKEFETSVWNTVTPADNTRASREKWKDPFRLGMAAKSSRQKSDPWRISHAQQQEILLPPTTTENGSSHRSSSVEGRLEGNPSDNSFEATRQYELVGDVSYPQNAKEEEESEVILRRAVMVERKETTPMSRAVIINRLSSSYGSLDDEILPEGLIKKHSINSLESCEGRSSTDSLTTTPLPGIYIRPNNSLNKLRKSLQNKTRENIPHWRDDHPRPPYLQHEPDFISTGPMSLDSSLSAVHYEEEFWKSSSANEVNGEELRSNLTPPSKLVTVLRSASVHSSTSSSRGSSGKSLKRSIGEELEIDSSLPRVSLRRVKKQPGLKSDQEVLEIGPVPEFMRIQLNRVQNTNNTVIFDTDQQFDIASSATQRTSPIFVQNKGDSMIVGSAETQHQGEVQEDSKKLKEPSEIIHQNKNLIEMNLQKNVISSVINKLPDTTKNATLGVSIIPTASHQQPFKESGHLKEQSEEQQRKGKEEIILRRPSVVDRAVVIDQTMETLPSPTPIKVGDEPELFKVFARRSFKLKDAELDAMIHGKHKNSEKDEEIHLTTQFQFGDQDGIMNKNDTYASSSSTTNTSVATIKNISTQRHSCGSLVQPFGNVTEHKPTMIFLPSNATPITNHSQIKAPTSRKLCNETALSKSEPKGEESVANISVLSRPTSQPSHTPHLQRNSKSEVDERIVSTLGDNVEIMTNINRSTTQVKKVNSFTKSGVHDYSPSTPAPCQQMRKTIEKDIYAHPTVSQDTKAVSPSLNSTIIRRSIIATSNIASFTSESSTTTGTQSPTVKSFKGQTVIWSQNQPLNTTDAIAGSPATNCVSRSSSKINPSESLLLHIQTESRCSNEDEHSHRVVQDPKPIPPLLIQARVSEGNPTLTDTRNITFSQSLDTNSTSLPLFHLEKSESSHTKFERKVSSGEGRNSLGGADDWRVLVRQRREDRMKQSKSPGAEEIIIEARPSVSRNSKVLEMANNFQKLQVA